MKYTLFFLFFLTFFLNASAQEIQILSKEDGEAVFFASITYLADVTVVGGNCTDEFGKIKLELKPEVNFIEISCIGYRNLKIAKKNITDTLYLEDISIELEQVIIQTPKRKKKKTKNLGYPVKYKNHSFCASRGFETVTFIENTFNKEKRIKSFLFHLIKWENSSPIFRVLFYTNENGVPIKSCLSNSKETTFILKPEQEKIRLDISHLEIIIPQEGIFVGLEYLGMMDTENNIIIPTNSDDLHTHTGISFLKSKNKNATYTYERRKFSDENKDWINLNKNKAKDYPFLKPDQFYVPAFAIEVYE